MPARKAAFDPGMLRALDAAGGRTALAGKLGFSPSRVRWRTCPREHLFAVERASGVDAEHIRPDLADWVRAERQNRRMARALDRFAIAPRRPGYVKPAGGAETSAARMEPPPGADALVSWGLVVAALRFAARERGLPIAEVWRGETREHLSAKSYAMALAHVAARVSSTAVAEAYGTSRQNIENAAERYLRARDGDDAEETLDGRGVHVLERGRVRRAKERSDQLWDAEARFGASIEGGERRRA